jgi:hypothetical protein
VNAAKRTTAKQMRVTGRITTRAGRKIRHVAPGHVVDVATGVTIERFGAGFTLHWRTQFCEQDGDVCRDGMTVWALDDVLYCIGMAEAVCVLVRVMLAIGGA